MADQIDFAPLHAAPAVAAGPGDLDRLTEVAVEVSVEIGRTSMTLGDALALGPGAVVGLNRMAGEAVDLLVNGKVIAHGEVVVIDEEFGLRVTEVVAPTRPSVAPAPAPLAEPVAEPVVASAEPVEASFEAPVAEAA